MKYQNILGWFPLKSSNKMEKILYVVTYKFGYFNNRSYKNENLVKYIFFLLHDRFCGGVTHSFTELNMVRFDL